jgi:hypothetical protein
VAIPFFTFSINKLTKVIEKVKKGIATLFFKKNQNNKTTQ